MKRITLVLFIALWAGARVCGAADGGADLLRARDVPGASVLAVVEDGVVLQRVPVLASDQNEAERRVTSAELSNRGYFKWEVDGKYYLRTSRKIFVYVDPSEYELKDAFDKQVYPCGRYEWAQDAEKTVELRAYTTNHAQAMALFNSRAAAMTETDDTPVEGGAVPELETISQPTYSIAIENAASSSDEKYMTFEAEVRNTGTEIVKQIKVTVNWLDVNGKPLRSDSTFAVLGEGLPAGQSRPFSIISPVDDRMRGYEYGVSTE